MSDKNKVLIVDDESIVRDSLEAWLAEEGFDVCSAKNGIEALEILKNQNIDIGVFDRSSLHLIFLFQF